ncbi:MAG: prepilin-type N-terminal cleavage/methylation domain-containing protein [Neisseriales bacterium]|nr:MAG: prepilin-type N-terminal cleavage/methylation domain-containing protein [Neisseriales bacterium]
MQRNKYPSLMLLGFTIIELMITVAIIAILGVTASSLYTSYEQRSNREMAKIELQQDASFMEQYYSQKGAYFDLNSNSWPANSVESYIYGASGAVYAVSFVPSQPTSSNKEAFSIIATPISDTIQSGDPSGRLCINQAGVVVENASASCNTSTTSFSWENSLCKPGIVEAPAMSTCANGDCSNKIICGACYAGNGGSYTIPGSCANNYIGGTCTGYCRNSTIKGTCTGDCQNTVVKGDCDGDCSNSVVCGSCSGTCSGVTKNGC